MTPKLQASLDQALSSLRRELGDNLYSCCLYGSAVRGNVVEGISDLNLLVVLTRSTPQAHDAVTKALGTLTEVEPFVLAKRGFERSVRAFAAKFASIKRNYKVLHGSDPLEDVEIEPGHERFLCEQAIRNFRLRLVYAYVTREKSKRYGQFVMQNITTIFVQFSEVLRLSGMAIPTDFEARIPMLEKEFGFDGKVLADLLRLRQSGGTIRSVDAQNWHHRIFPLADSVLVWLERQWEI